ncbi:MAG TPA: hypothetical protein VFL38_00120 [Humibacillus xanthopallidus]|nr:hypothetical protein [Humibacillus xanthopallidus]
MMTTSSRAPARGSTPRRRSWVPALGAALAAVALVVAVAVVSHGPLSAGRAGAAPSSAPSSTTAALARECGASLTLASAMAALPAPAAAPSSPRGAAVGGGVGAGSVSPAPVLRSTAAALAAATRSPDLRELLQNSADDAAAHAVAMRSGDLDRQRDTALALHGDAAGLRRFCTGTPRG